MRPPARWRGDEFLDAPVHEPGELRGALEHVADVNRWLGGSRALRGHLRPLLGGERSLLDVGAGNGAVAGEMVRWAARRGATWRIVALELNAQIAALASERARAMRHAASGSGGGRGGVAALRADALHLPFPDGAFDAAFTVLTLHHFGVGDAVRLVAEMARVSRGFVLVNDLERSHLAHLGARLLAATLWRGNRLTRHDGPLSVLRSFTADELLEVGRRAGLRHVRVLRHPAFRLVLEGRA